jgi:ubiquinone biosynthesis protein
LVFVVGIFSISQSKQDLDRVAEILNLVARFEWGEFADRIRIGERLPIRLPRHKPVVTIARTTPQERLRMVLEELGTTFVKFGQLLSTRGDIIGADYADELSKLQDKMKPFPSDQAKQIIAEELGSPVGSLFASFQSEPMASASIGQVHRAVLKNGKRVVVKVQRPGIFSKVKEDLRIMRYLALQADKHIPEIKEYDPVYLVDEFERSIMKEMDFLREAKSAARLKENFKGDSSIYIPAVYEEMCTMKVMVMEEVIGEKLSNIISSRSKKYDRTLIAKRCMRAFFKMVLVDGFYHADMHPGNLMILKKNVVCFLDFGRVGAIGREAAESIFRLALFAVEDDTDGLVAHMIRTGMISDSDNTDSFKADVSDVLDKYYSKDIVEVKMGQMLSDLMSVIAKYNFKRPREIAELTRSLLILEGVCNNLDPEFNIAEEFEPYAQDILPRGLGADKVMDIVKGEMLDLEYIARTIPSALRSFFRKVDEGKLKIELEHKDLMVFSADLDRISNKLSVAMLVSALILASAIMVKVNGTVGMVGFVVSGIVGVWLMLKILLD